MSKRLERLMKTVGEEQTVAFMKPNAENIESLKRLQDRLMHYAIRSGRSVPYALFFAPPVIEGDALKMLCSRCREHTTYREHEGSRRCGPATLGRLASKADIAGFENWQTNATEDLKDRLRRENAAVAYAAAEAGIEPPKRRRAPVEAVNACHGTITADEL